MALLGGLISPDDLTETLALLIKLLLATGLAAAIGWERKAHGRPAGLRTHILIVLGVVLFCEASKVFAPESPGRIAAQVVTGIGFLGAGTIMRTGVEIRGLTSAASVWATAAIGMAVSTGGALVYVAVVATALVLFTLSLLERIEDKYNPGALPGRLQAILDDRSHLASLLMRLQDAQIQVGSIHVVEDAGAVRLLIETSGFPDKALSIALGSSGVRDARLLD